jgi:predicted 2-oxoglutarate/Fe(II)-dependent dioxygenase YbiX
MNCLLSDWIVAPLAMQPKVGIVAVLGVLMALWSVRDRFFEAPPPVPQPPVVEERMDVEVLDETPRGPRSQHCGVVGTGLAQHPRCRFRSGARICERLVVEDFATQEEVDAVLELARAGMGVGRAGEGGVTLVDLSHGIVSYGRKFANLFKAMEKGSSAELQATLRSERHLSAYEGLIDRIQSFVADRFLSSPNGLSFAKPAFISLITNDTAQIPNDEYWHVHVDTDQYGSFDVTTLLYLSDQVEDPNDAGTTTFTGGNFEFVDSEQDAEVAAVLALPPARGRLLVFTSGSEHPHRVSPVTSGHRWAMTTAFSCDASGKKNARRPLADLRRTLKL